MTNIKNSVWRGAIRSPTLADWQLYSGAALLVVSIFGYPLAGLLVSVIGVESTVITLPYRVLVLTSSAVLILSGMFSPLRGRLDLWLMIFMALYLVRLLYDYYFISIERSDLALQIYFATALVPTLAIGLSGAHLYRDQTLGRPMIISGIAAALLALWAQSSGLAYNPWENEIAAVRLGFVALNPISLGHVGVSTVLTGLFFVSTQGVKLTWRLIGLAAIVLGGILLVRTESRGALAALVLCVVWFGISKTRHFVFLIPVFLIVAFMGVSQLAIVEKTIDTMMGGWQFEASAQERLLFQELAIHDFYDAPLIGKNFVSQGAKNGEYPHNIVIETAMALGVVGLFVVLIVVFRTVRNVLKDFNSDHPLITILLIQYAVGAQMSGTLWGSGTFYTLLLLALQRSHWKTQVLESKAIYYDRPFDRKERGIRSSSKWGFAGSKKDTNENLLISK